VSPWLRPRCWLAWADGTSYSHYSVLAGIEDAYGLSPLGGAATANPIPIP
jgi:hypothetical protein